MNNVNETGRLANDPELSYTPGGATVVHFDIAVRKKTSDRNAPPDYFPVTCWNQTAEFAHKYLHKGRLIALSGHLATKKWTDRCDQNRKDVYIVADSIEPLDSGKAAPSEGNYEEGQ